MTGKAFPQVARVQDQAAAEVLRLLWDRLHACEDALARCQAELRRVEAQAENLPPFRKIVARLQQQVRRFGL